MKTKTKTTTVSVPRYAVKLVKLGKLDLPLSGREANGPEAAAKLARELLADEPREKLLAFYFAPDGKTVLGVEEIAHGSISSVAAQPTDVFRGAILAGAWGIMLAHNHPSGLITPSEQDKSHTLGMACAARYVGLVFLDAIVVGPSETEWASIAEIMSQDIRTGFGLDGLDDGNESGDKGRVN